MERRARAHASKRRGAHKHPRLPLLLQIHPLRSVARRARIGPTRTGLHRRGSARARGKGRERRADHLPHLLLHLASKRFRRRSFCTLPPPRVGRRARLPPRESASTHTAPGARVAPSAVSPLGARPAPLPHPRPRRAPRRPPKPPAHAPPPLPPRHRCSPPSPRARASSRATNSAAPPRAQGAPAYFATATRICRYGDAHISLRRLI